MINKGEHIVPSTLFIGQKIKGFKFDSNNSVNLKWDENMIKYIGVEGIVKNIYKSESGTGYRLIVRFIRDAKHRNSLTTNWIYAAYPLAEYLEIIREEKLNELGI